MWASLRQFRLICWKNFIFLKERIVLTVIQLFLPVIFIIILFGIRQKLGPVEYPEKSYNKTEFGYERIFFSSSQLNRVWGIGFYSETPDLKDLTDYIITSLKENMQNRNNETKIMLYSEFVFQYCFYFKYSITAYISLVVLDEECVKTFKQIHFYKI